MEKEEVINRIIQNRAFIESKGAIRIGLFGSYSKNTQSKDSDIDFLVHFDDKKTNFDNFIELSMFFEDIFDRKVELITSESIDSDFYTIIKKDLIYAY